MNIKKLGFTHKILISNFYSVYNVITVCEINISDITSRMKVHVGPTYFRFKGQTVCVRIFIILTILKIVPGVVSCVYSSTSKTVGPIKPIKI